jgi:hypothetical protein
MVQVLSTGHPQFVQQGYSQQYSQPYSQPYLQQTQTSVPCMMPTSSAHTYAQPVASYYQTTQQAPMYTTTAMPTHPVMSAPFPQLPVQNFRPPQPSSQQQFIAPPDPQQPLQKTVNSLQSSPKKNVLQIVNPKTNELVNKDEYERSRRASGGDVPATRPYPGTGGLRRRVNTEQSSNGYQQQANRRDQQPPLRIQQRLGVVKPLEFTINIKATRQNSESSDSQRAPSSTEDAETTKTADASDQEENSVPVADPTPCLMDSGEASLSSSTTTLASSPECTIGEETEEQVSHTILFLLYNFYNLCIFWLITLSDAEQIAHHLGLSVIYVTLSGGVDGRELAIYRLRDKNMYRYSI